MHLCLRKSHDLRSLQQLLAIGHSWPTLIGGRTAWEDVGGLCHYIWIGKERGDGGRDYVNGLGASMRVGAGGGI